MANRTLFSSISSRLPRANATSAINATNATGEAGGQAYKLAPKHAFAQIAATGTFGNAFYSKPETQLQEVLTLIDQVDDNEFLARLALYARQKAYMKDMPAALLVALSLRDNELPLRSRVETFRDCQVRSSSGLIHQVRWDALLRVIVTGVQPARCVASTLQHCLQRRFCAATRIA